MPKVNVIEKQRKRLEKIFYPTNPFGNPMDSAKVILSVSKDFLGECRDLMELRLYAVEYAMDFSQNYGDIDAAYYRWIMKYFDQCCKFIDKQKTPDLFEEYDNTLCRLVEYAGCFGWGMDFGFQDSYDRIHWVKEAAQEE